LFPEFDVIEAKEKDVVEVQMSITEDKEGDQVARAGMGKGVSLRT
jgi:hypothetical protein